MREREVKLTPSPGFRLPPLSGVVAGVTARPDEILDLQAVYYDTPDLRLTRVGASLRYRNGEGWTVKLPLPAAPDARSRGLLERAEHTFAGAPGSPPAPAVDLVRAWVRSAPVEARVRLKTRRRRVELCDAGEHVAEVVDDEVSVLDGGRISARFRELEVELAESAPADVASAIVARLRAAGAGPPDPTPKIVRALGAPALEPPDVVVETHLSGASRTHDVIRAAFAGAVGRLLANDAGVRIGDDPEYVHQARVATRRLRSDLRTFRPLLDPAWDADLRDELRWLGAELGAVRDAEVLLDLLRAKEALLPERDRAAAERLLHRLVHHWEDARIALLVAVRSPRYTALLDRLVDAAREPAVLPEPGAAPARDVLPPLVRGPWKHLRSAADALHAGSANEALHDVRIRAKRCRYAAEAVAPAVGKSARVFAREVAGLQEILGDHHDAVVAMDWLRDAAAAAERREDAFAAGAMAGHFAMDELRLRADWPAAWRRARRRRLRAWM